MGTSVAYQHRDVRSRMVREGQRREARLSSAEILILAVSLMILAAAAVLPSISVGTEAPVRTQTVSVRTSQSLWDLARAYPQDGKSIAQTVEAIRRLNGLEQSALTPGQLLLVPAQPAVFAADARP